MKNKIFLQLAAISAVIGITSMGTHAFAALPGETAEFDQPLESLYHNLSRNLALSGEIGNDQIIQNISNWEEIDTNTALSKPTMSRYTAKYGTQLIMNVFDITDLEDKSSSIVQSTAMSINPRVVE